MPTGIDRTAILAHMPVVGPDGRQMGTVDHLDGDRIKLTKADAPDGQHHFVRLQDVDAVRDGKVWLNGEALVK